VNGSFTTRVNYSKTLTRESRQFAGDPLNDDLHDLGNADWRDKLNASLSWKAGDWTNTLFLQRYGKIPNGSGEAWLSPTTLVYRLNHHFGS